MEQIFIDVVNMSLTAGVVILAVLVLRLFFARAPKIFSYVLWAIVLFRLLCPLSFRTNFSLLGLFGNASNAQGKMEYVSNFFTYQTNTDGQFGTAGIENGAGNALTQGTALASTSPMRLLLTIATWVWVIGLLVMVACSTVSILRLHKKLKQAVPEGKHIYRMSYMGTPFVYGLFRPEIYLPEHLGEKEKSYILLHEQIHIRRGDHIFRFLGYLALCIHWFNPLVWLAFWLSGKDMEMSCDEAVIRSMGNKVKKPYSMSLLEMASGSRGITFRPIAFGEGDAENRIKNILRYKKPARALVILAIVVCVILALVLIANPSEKDSDADNVSINLTDVPEIDLSDESAKQTLAEQFEQQMQDEEEVPNLTWEVLKNGISDGNYRIYIRDISRSAKGIDLYVLEDYDRDVNSEELPFLAFGADCIYYINQEMASIRYESDTFDTFADNVAGALSYLNVPCTVRFQNGVITEAYLDSAWYAYGISYEPEHGDVWAYEDIGELSIPTMTDEEALDTFYSLAKTVQSDVGDGNGTETIEVYTGNLGDGDSGFVQVKNDRGELLYSEGAHCARAGWNNIYLGEKDGTAYLMTLHIEDRDTYGSYGYQVFRIGENGQVLQIAGSDFEFDADRITYDDSLFHEWADMMSGYLENCQLLLSTQEGELSTQQASPAELYNYETLRRE
jgi:beta-lactamase regulating signal transducer with metallopeptidase domain